MFPDAMPPTAPVDDSPRLESLMDYKPSDAVQREIDAYESGSMESLTSDEEANPTAGPSNPPSKGLPFQNLRSDAVREAALSVGTQAGLYARYNAINSILDGVARNLDTAFNFEPVAIMDGRVLPPVIAEAKNALRVNADGMVAYSSATTWQMVEPSRIVTAMPDWRSYLERHFADVDVAKDVHPLLLPTDKKERDLWQHSVKLGWKQGVEQANAIFSRGLFALLRDLKGMMRYHMLEKRHVVKKARLSEGRKGVTLSRDGKTLSVDDRVYRLTDSTFQTDSRKWLAIPLSHK